MNLGLGGFHQHTSAIGELVSSLYAAGSADLLDGPDDPRPGVPSIRAVMGQLKTKGLNHVVSLDVDQASAICQSKCLVTTLVEVASQMGLVPQLPELPTNCTVGAAVLRQQIPPELVNWVDVLTTSGLISRHQVSQLPPDALLLAVSLQLPQQNPD